MTAKEAIEYLFGRYLVVGSKCNPPEDECKKHNEVVDMAIEALKKNEKSLAKKLYEKYVPVLEGSKHTECINTFTLKDMPIESMEEIVNALKTVSDLQDRGMNLETLENYMQFEDECIKKNFTFKSILKAREKQIAKKPIHNDKKYYTCPNCGCNMGIDDVDIYACDEDIDLPNHCVDCGQKLDWK